MNSFLELITYYYTLNLDIHISNYIHSNIHILIIYILKILELCMDTIVLLYDQLYLCIIIYPDVFFIAYWCTYMYIHLYSVQYFCMEPLLYMYIGTV